MKTVVGLVDTERDGQELVEELVASGIPRADITLTSRGERERESGFTAFFKRLFGGLRTESGEPVDQEHVGYYEEGVAAGGTLVAVRTPDDMTERVAQLLEAYGARSVHEQAREPNETVQRQGETVVPVAREELRVGKRDVERGRVRIFGHVSEEPVEEEVELGDTLRRKDVDVRREGGVAAGASAFDALEPDFRRHYTTAFTGTGPSYEQCQPAYRYGYDLAGEQALAGSEWAAVEPEARRRWEIDRPGTMWDQFRDAIRYGWDAGRKRKAA